MGKTQIAYVCTSFARLKKLVEFLYKCDWDSLSRATRAALTTGYITYGDKTAVFVEPDKTISIFGVGTLEGFEYSFFVPEESEDESE